jgi:cytochrome c oxidase cbb3-type subunit 3
MKGWLTALLCVASLAACEREQRHYNTPPSAASAAGPTQQSSLQPGPKASAAFAAYASGPGPTAPPPPEQSTSALMGPSTPNPHEENANAVSQGKRLFRWYNCNGCHAGGGGGIGPPLMDDQWRYGHEASQIVATILQGRPNGMPSFAGRIPEDQAWQIAAYVRSMSGQLRSDIAPSRSDGLSAGPPEQRRDREHPKKGS